MRCRAEVSTDRLCEARRHDDPTVGTWATQRASTRAPWPGARHARPLRALLLPRAAGHTYLGRRHTRRPALPPILSNGRLVPLTGDPFGRLCRSGWPGLRHRDKRAPSLGGFKGQKCPSHPCWESRAWGTAITGTEQASLRQGAERNAGTSAGSEDFPRSRTSPVHSALTKASHAFALDLQGRGRTGRDGSLLGDEPRQSPPSPASSKPPPESEESPALGRLRSLTRLRLAVGR